MHAILAKAVHVCISLLRINSTLDPLVPQHSPRWQRIALPESNLQTPSGDINRRLWWHFPPDMDMPPLADGTHHIVPPLAMARFLNRSVSDVVLRFLQFSLTLPQTNLGKGTRHLLKSITSIWRQQTMTDTRTSVNKKSGNTRRQRQRRHRHGKGKCNLQFQSLPRQPTNPTVTRTQGAIDRLPRAQSSISAPCPGAMVLRALQTGAHRSPPSLCKQTRAMVRTRGSKTNFHWSQGHHYT
jgi:hypothetical protein